MSYDKDKPVKYPVVWRCYKMALITSDLVVNGEIEYRDTYGPLFDRGYRILKASKEAIPSKSGFICDCGEWVNGDDHFHKVTEWREKF